MDAKSENPAGSAELSRTFTWRPPNMDAATIASTSGLDYLQGLLAGGGGLPIGALMDFRPVQFEHGRAVFEGTASEFHYNPIGAVHGGFAATLLDSALACAVHTTLKPGFAYTTLELKVKFVKAITMATGTVTAEGRVVHVGSRIATSDARISDAAGKLYAHGTTTCLIFPVDSRLLGKRHE